MVVECVCGGAHHHFRIIVIIRIRQFVEQHFDGDIKEKWEKRKYGPSVQQSKSIIS